ncbi:16036_t:CDS:2 [Funneliformis geosporum]|nr:16036_t:CDS:2 [Funneliformis geosporum]
MVDQVLCTFIWCLQKSNGQGKMVSQATRARHKKNQNKTWSNQKNIPVQQRHLDTSIPAANITSTSPLPLSDNISMLSQININEEYRNHDVEMISDELSNEDQIKILENEIDKIAILEDEKDKEDEIEISEEEDEENEENEEDNEEDYNREYNGNISEDLIKGLQLLKIKKEHNISEAAFDEILKVFEISRISLYKLHELINKNTCPYCKEDRYKYNQVARKHAAYWSLYKGEINKKVFGNDLERILDYSESHIFIVDGAKEKLLSPSCRYCMNRTEMQRLRAYYITALNIHTNQLALITDSVQKYGKLQINGKLAINSKLSNRKYDVARTNFCIVVCILLTQTPKYSILTKFFI